MTSATLPIPDVSDVSAQERRSTDLTKTFLTLPVVVAVVVFFAALVGSFWAINARTTEKVLEMQSDLREIRTRMEMQTQIDNARSDARAIEIKSQNESITELRRLVQLLQLQYAELSKQIQGKK